MAKPKQPKRSNTEISAEAEVLKALDDALCQTDIGIFSVIECLDRYTESIEKDCDKSVEKIIRKIVRYIDKGIVDNANRIDSVVTKIQIYLYNAIEQQGWTLSQLCVKCGWIAVGGDINIVVNQQCEELKGPKDGPTITLDCSMLIPIAKELVEVLREIRNRLPPLPIEEAFEDPADYNEPKYSDAKVIIPNSGAEIVIDPSILSNGKSSQQVIKNAGPLV